MLYQYRMLQSGSLPLRPDGGWETRPHACTATLVWPHGAPLADGPALVTDPCFTQAGLVEAKWALAELGGSFNSISGYFETHGHADHVGSLDGGDVPSTWHELRTMGFGSFPGLAVVPLPGHSPDLAGIVVPTAEGQAWIVGDAVLDEEWLRAWGYYYPNEYIGSQIVQTWISVAQIVRRANVIVPGHGEPIRVTKSLVADLLAGFHRAEYSHACADVPRLLQERVSQLTQ